MTQDQNRPTRFALLSVSDKNGLPEFAQSLIDAGFSLLSTGGTASTLRDAGFEVTEVADLTGFPEVMAGRVKTLHPTIHGGLLGRKGIDEAVMAEHQIPSIDLLCLNLYPFEATVANPECSLADAIENIDIGGPAMLRAGAKNFGRVSVVTDPSQYQAVAEELGSSGGRLGDKTRFALSVEAFNHVSRYDAAISDYLSSVQDDGSRAVFPAQANGRFAKLGDLRYGENPHQQAAWYRDMDPAPGSLVNLNQLQGKELSFNNIADADAAWSCVRQFEAPTCVIVKHANPCGVASGPSLVDAYQRAFGCDSTSAFGGIIAFNRELDDQAAKVIIDQQFVEVLIAPSVSTAALATLASKPNVRVLEIPPVEQGEIQAHHDIKRIESGLLIQTADSKLIARDDCKVVTRRSPTDEEWADLMFAWKVGKMVKSNAIVYAATEQTLGIGAGQMSRVDSARIARWKAGDAGLSLEGAAMASDAFFPFRDGIDTAAEAGIRAVIQPGGSMRDDEVTAAADEADIAMVFTSVRHFRH